MVTPSTLWQRYQIINNNVPKGYQIINNSVKSPTTLGSSTSGRGRPRMSDDSTFFHNAV